MMEEELVQLSSPQVAWCCSEFVEVIIVETEFPCQSRFGA